MWMHEHFDLPEAPDLVTFSKKMLSGGIYHKVFTQGQVFKYQTNMQKDLSKHLDLTLL